MLGASYSLKLIEEIVLIGLDDRKGVFLGTVSGMAPIFISAAAIMDLVFTGRIEFIDKKITLKNAQTTGDELLDETLAIIQTWKKPRALQDAIRRISGGVKKLKKRLLESLVDRGVLRREQRRFLFLPYSVYPASDDYSEMLVKQRIRQVVLEGQPADQQTEVLIALMDAGGLMKAVFEKSERPVAKARFKEISKNSAAGAAIKELIAQMHAAIIVVGQH